MIDPPLLLSALRAAWPSIAQANVAPPLCLIPSGDGRLRPALGCSEAAAAELAGSFTLQALDRGAAVLHHGQVWQHALVVEAGLVRMHFVRRDGREFNKNFFAEGALVCPLTPAMWAAPSLFGISALEATRLWRCDAAVFRQVLQRHGHWAPLQTELLSRLLTGKLQREHDLMALDGRQRYEAFCQRFPGLAARVPLLHLATYLGMTDVSLSRVRRGLRNEP